MKLEVSEIYFGDIAPLVVAISALTIALYSFWFAKKSYLFDIKKELVVNHLSGGDFKTTVFLAREYCRSPIDKNLIFLALDDIEDGYLLNHLPIAGRFLFVRNGSCIVKVPNFLSLFFTMALIKLIILVALLFPSGYILLVNSSYSLTQSAPKIFGDPYFIILIFISFLLLLPTIPYLAIRTIIDYRAINKIVTPFAKRKNKGL